MPFSRIVEPAQLALLKTTLDELCLEFDINPSDAATRDALAYRILHFFENGADTSEELKQALRSDWPAEMQQTGRVNQSG